MGNGQSSSADANLDPVTNQLSDLAVTPSAIGKEHSGDAGSLSSTSSESSEEGDVLERAGVVGVDLSDLETGPDGKAPIELMSQVLQYTYGM